MAFAKLSRRMLLAASAASLSLAVAVPAQVELLAAIKYVTAEDLPLLAQDIADQIPWVIDEPYMLPRDPKTKKCVCMDAAGACTIYEKRPASCRVYDCREDPRVWIDFDKRIPAEMPPKITSVPRP